MPDLTTRASLAEIDSVLFAALDFLVGAIDDMLRSVRVCLEGGLESNLIQNWYVMVDVM